MLNDLTPLRMLPKQIEAACYRRVRLALAWGAPAASGIEIILDDNIWLGVDSLAEDQPVLAWRDFQAHGRDNLHHPIRSRCGGWLIITALGSLWARH